jgi:tyrosyl-DNA phosphodiesterase 2
MVNTINPGYFNAGSGRWEPSLPAKDGLVAVSQLKLLTYNIWFGAFASAERTDALLSVLQESDADIIALQEVTPAVLYRILQSPWVQASYAVSDFQGVSLNSYGVLLLSRVPVTSWNIYPLPSAMHRNLLTVDINASGSLMRVATVHLESISICDGARAEQLSKIFPILAAVPHAVLMGDFNFCSSNVAENKQLDPQYQDVWPTVHPGDPGYTEDTAVNQMRFEQSGKNKQVRFDRVLFRSKNSEWKPEQIRLIGTTPVHTGTPSVFPSDHFGLVCTLQK